MKKRHEDMRHRGSQLEDLQLMEGWKTTLLWLLTFTIIILLTLPSICIWYQEEGTAQDPTLLPQDREMIIMSVQEKVRGPFT